MRFFFLEEKFKMEMNIGSRLKHAWNAFLNRDPPGSRYYGGGYSYRPDRMRFSRGSERTIINAIYNRIALDAASITINHVKLDENNRFDSIIDSGLNYCLNTEANADQTGRGLVQDIVMTFLEEGVAAVVPEKTNFDPRYSNSYEIYSMRVGVPVEWYPNHVRVRLFNELTGQKEEITFPKKMVALIENPFYAVMNAPNSTMQQLVRKLALLDVVDEQAGSGKLDMIIQLPYVIKSPARREQAEQRRADIEQQLSGSKYGIAYTDGTERIVQLNRSLENNILKSIEYLTNMVYSQLGVTQERKDIIGVNNAQYAATAGNYTMYENIGQVTNQGIDIAINWKGNIGRDFLYTVGANMTYSKNKLDKWNEIEGVESYRKAIGRPTSTIFGLQALGLFGKDIPLEDHSLQSYGIYQNGDIAYADLNNNGIVDDNDRMSLGQSFPITTWGINVDLKYKGFGLYMLGTLHTGITQLCTNAYYWNNGLNGYSELALNRYHEVNNPSGTMPRLTTTTESNNFRDSSFWTENGSFFRLKNVELSYTFENKAGRFFANKCKLFVRGTNLLTFSKIKDLDPERLNAGITNYPAYMTVTGGLSVSF